MAKDNNGKVPFFVQREVTAPMKDYIQWIADLKQRYRKAQVRAAVKVNGEMLRFYWSLGRDIMVKNAEAKWGSGFLKRTSLNLQEAFPGSTGLSYENLKAARRWYKFYYQRSSKGYSL